MSETLDFGAPPGFGIHHFVVDIPAGPRDAISIHEDYGFDGDEHHKEATICRVVLARELWSKIRDDARRDFNERLKVKKLSPGTWKTGRIKLDRFLGRELCVLAWAAEHASPKECPIICQKWLALRPEERWWLFSKTAAEAGSDHQTRSGWRKALYCALSDGEQLKLQPKTRPRKKKADREPTPLFDLIEKGNI